MGARGRALSSRERPARREMDSRTVRAHRGCHTDEGEALEPFLERASAPFRSLPALYGKPNREGKPCRPLRHLPNLLVPGRGTQVQAEDRREEGEGGERSSKAGVLPCVDGAIDATRSTNMANGALRHRSDRSARTPGATANPTAARTTRRNTSATGRQSSPEQRDAAPPAASESQKGGWANG